MQVLRNISNKKWDTIIGHAITCTLDDNKYIYRTAEGTVLLFNSIYKVVGVTFDGHSYHSVDSLNMYQMVGIFFLRTFFLLIANSSIKSCILDCRLIWISFSFLFCCQKMVEDLKQQAYRNLNDWEDYEAGPNIGPHDANLHVRQGK